MATPYSEPLVWRPHPLPLLQANGEAYHYDAGDEFYVMFPVTRQGIYHATASFVTKISLIPGGYDTTDFDSHLPAEMYLRTDGNDIVLWEKNKTYYFNNPNKGGKTDHVFVDWYYSVYYECVAESIEQPIFSIWLDPGPDYPPLNINNQIPERVTSGIHNEGVYLLPRGDLADLEFVPRWPGLLYLELGQGRVFAYADGNGPSQYFGWYEFARADLWGGVHVFTDTEVLGKPMSLIGTGSAADYLRILDAIPDYDPGADYPLGTVVNATFGRAKGIYKKAEDRVRVWQQFGPTPSEGMRWLQLDTPTLLYPGDYFYVNQITSSFDSYDGIFKVSINLLDPLNITIGNLDITQLAAAIGAGQVEEITTNGQCLPWEAGHMYHANDMVYANYDYSKLYVRLIDDTQDTIQQTFDVYEEVLQWRLLADIDRKNSVVGMMTGWIWTDPADPTDPPIPEGYMKCDNTLHPKAQYPELYRIVGDRYKKSTDTDGTLFRLPYADNQIIFAGGI
jgi:hypothetical protein